MSKNKFKFDKKDEDDFSEDDEEWDDEICDEDDELTSEMSEERGGYVYLRYRDSLGRFASPVTDPERIRDIEMDRQIRKFEGEYRKQIELPYNVKILLLRLVDNFSESERLLDDKGFLNPKVSHFKRLPYHQVFLDFTEHHHRHLKRSAFSQFITRMENEGLVRKIKHGHKLYLKITQKGLDKVFPFLEEYPGESWRMP